MNKLEIDKWLELIESIEEATGWECFSFSDCDFVLCKPKDFNHLFKAFLPKSFVEDFNKKLKASNNDN